MTHYKHYKHFKKIHIPDHWEQYWSKYPNGYTLLEALISWTGQVNDMIKATNKYTDHVRTLDINFRALEKELRASWKGYKESTEQTYKDFREEILTIVNNWIATIEPTIQNVVVESLTTWLEDGTLADIINEDVFNMKADKKDVDSREINVLYPPSPLQPVKMDGTTDDSANLQAIIDYVTEKGTGGQYPSESYGYTIIIPAGVMILRNKITVNGSGVTLKGLGRQSTIIMYDGDRLSNDEYLFNVIGTSSDRLMGFSIQDLTIRGETDSNTGENRPRGIFIDHVSDWEIKRINVFYLHQGFRTRNAWVGLVEKSAFKHNYRSCYLDGQSHNVSVRNNAFGRTISGYSSGSVSSHLSVRNSWGVSISNNDFEFGNHANIVTSIYLYNSVYGIEINNNYFESNTGYAVYLRDDTSADGANISGLSFTANFVNHNNGKGIYIRKDNASGQSHEGIVVRGNYFYLDENERIIVESSTGSAIGSVVENNAIVKGLPPVESTNSGFNELKVKTVESYNKSYSNNSAPRNKNENISLWDYARTPYASTPTQATTTRRLVDGVTYLVTLQLTESDNKMHSSLHLIHVKGDDTTVTDIIPVTSGVLSVIESGSNKYVQYIKDSGFSCGISMSVLPLTGDNNASEIFI